MNEEHRFGLMKIKERDALIDDHIVELGKGIDELREIAVVAREEVTLQNKMLDTLQVRVDDVHDHVININAKLKETLEKVFTNTFHCLC